MPRAICAPIPPAKLRDVFGFDKTTGSKLAAATLDRQGAAAILERLEAIASSAEALVQRLETQ